MRRLFSQDVANSETFSLFDIGFDLVLCEEPELFFKHMIMNAVCCCSTCSSQYSKTDSTLDWSLVCEEMFVFQMLFLVP